MRHNLSMVLVPVALAACTRSAAIPHDPTFADVPIYSIDSLLPKTRTVALTGDVKLGEIYGLTVTPTQIVALDPTQGHINFFNRATGELIRQAGRAGDGPGEFRGPVKIELDSLAMVVLDVARHIVSRRDTAGGFVADQLSGNWFSMGSIAGTDTLLLFGRMKVGSQVATNDSSWPVIHEADKAGTVIRSYWPDPRATDQGESFFNNHFGSANRATVIAGSYNTNRVHFHDRATGREWESKIGAPWYRPVDWAKDGMKKGEFFTKWVEHHTLLFDLNCLARGLFLATFQLYTPKGERQWGYVVFDSAGHSLYATEPSPSRVLRVVGDTLFATIANEDGDFAVETRALPKWVRAP